uniref:Uncharacterized protein n=1 Tax=Timema monikensis TaxID=170555 RepID=A0A7R9HSU7_9NEOP|nr:unnamed protein product [Timema monikensis]
MGGVDHFDQNIFSYKVNMIMFPLNASVNNAWQLYCLAPKGKEDTLDSLSFTRYIVQTYLAKYSIRVASGPSPKTLEKNILQLDTTWWIQSCECEEHDTSLMWGMS